MVKAICRTPFSAACRGGWAASMGRTMFSIMTIASSTTKPVAMVSAISDRLLRLEPAEYMTPNVPTSDSGMARLGMMVAGTWGGTGKITSTTRPTDGRRV